MYVKLGDIFESKDLIKNAVNEDSGKFRAIDIDGHLGAAFVVWQMDIDNGPNRQLEERAEKIVCACNAHDDLVKALEMCQEKLIAICNDRNLDYPHAITVANDALAKAKGEQND